MNAKFLLILLSAAGFFSCSTAYKSGQTPDDVYYSPARVIAQENRKEEQNNYTDNIGARQEREIRMGTRDRRWRELDQDYDDYNYNHHCNCYCNQYGYGYYNHPYYFYNSNNYYSIAYNKIPVNSTPRMVGLGSYNMINNGKVFNPKTNNGTNWVGKGTQYNNGNNTSGGNGFGNFMRQIFKPSGSSSNNSSSGGNNNRTYTPTSGSSNNNSGSNNSGGTTVTRPGRGG